MNFIEWLIVGVLLAYPTVYVIGTIVLWILENGD